MCFHANDAEMFGQWQHNPVAKMFIECDQGALLLSGAFENQRVIGPRLSDF